LESAEVRDCEDDALLTGATALNLIWGMCAATIKVFTAMDNRYDIASRYLKADKESFVIHDMSKLDQYKDRPYVAGWPYMRFYAEVPISSPSGLAIGSICVVDFKPRDSFALKQMDQLKEIAVTVMDHLDLVMSRVQRKRSQQMIKGLGVFARARSGPNSTSSELPAIDDSMRELRIKDSIQDGSTTSLESQSPRHRENSSSSQQASDYFTMTSSSRTNQGAQKMTPVSASIAEWSDGRESTIGSSSPLEGVNKPSRPDIAPGAGTKHDSNTNIRNEEQTPETGLPQTLSQAVHLIRDAVDLDTLVFYDQRHSGNPGFLASTGKHGKLRRDNPQSMLQLGEMLGIPNPGLNAKVLAISSHANRLPSDILGSLLGSVINRLPNGGILRFGPDNEFSELAEFDQSNNGVHADNISGRPVTDFEITDAAQTLNKSFKSRSMILFPLWSPIGDELFAYAIGTTCHHTRIFQREDFAYITSFSSLVTSELSRLNFLSADRAKSAFISSISHELRSPLHGILASSELLKDSVKDDRAIDIINTIESCGLTLLDTFDNLLAFAKINYFNVDQTRKQREGLGKLGRAGSRKVSKDIKGLTSNFDLGVLVENVMNSNIAGHYLRASLDDESSHQSIKDRRNSVAEPNKLTVICDIKHEDWLISSQPGAWTRILMNLLGNAMKYTSSGFVRVRLGLDEKSPSDLSGKEREIILCVEDTGRGISEIFMSNHLYKPFYQEDDLNPGTGLGLSIVKQLVQSIKGTINVTSEVGQGTICTVTAKLSRPETGDTSIPQSKTMQLPSEHHGLRIGFSGFDSLPSIEENPTGILSRVSQRNYAIQTTLMSAVQSLGLVAKTVTSLTAEDVDIFLTTEENYQMTRPASGTRKTPIIILSSPTAIDYREPNLDDRLAYLSQPFGPKRLIMVLKSSFAIVNGTGEAVGSIAVQPEPEINSPDILEAVEIPSPTLNEYSVSPVNSQQGRPKVLLVEDNAINLKVGASLASSNI
jgi:signal transduction histidine kinase